MIQTIKHPDGLKKRTIDNLKYQYSGNQLFSVRDKLTEVCENYGFLNNGSSVKAQNTGVNYTNDREYYYDANGNLIKDRNKGIEGIEYNLLNLPKRILYKQNNAIYYTYDASGVKWAKEIHKDGGIKRFDYLGNFVYEDHVLKYIITDYGKIVISKVNNPFIRYYDLRDHLGNVRASFRANDNNTLTLLQEDSYYPFGMQQPAMSYLSRGVEHKNLHLYNGKELQTDFDLNWYDYGARFYDAELVRFHTLDRFTEKYSSLTPYQYGANNPILMIDVNGDSLWINYQGNDILYQNGNLYNQNGTVYKGKGTKLDKNGNVVRYKGFLKKTKNSLSIIASTTEGGAMLKELQNSTNNFKIIRNIKSKFIASNSTKAYANQAKTDPNHATSYSSLINMGVSMKGGSGGTIYWQPSGTILPTTHGTQVNSIVDLAHEMFHGLDANRGLLDSRKYLNADITRSEWQACYRENVLRAQMGVPLRTHYITDTNSLGVVIGGRGPRIITSTNKPILPSWYVP